ncbi:phosphate regulon sensor histidine kinase PhoR [Thauera linaloolentis]|uniref:histidine kinase n=1 Tax=Thauera linaloolentis (strain DSM 12138 / JCM 21573 / CCUG 41526 / CIP 105981 / IAM 15112 / NBRC 102519 / 47Lol) TaxID=1123367 RepID=N6YVL7_THAL4|nr:phosphate regulon sensor histidine kinase PhoR [Thauera linaloolentis]ENO86193.1 histidine kinase [Thauera linaloolentis 47Lol = DSM 12138]MCM8567241.1 phosphate regulon sensor histidine kinase PhoR [Thauera linaloolentis]
MIHRPLRYIATGVGVPVAAVLVLALLAGYYRGADAALALVVLGLLAIAILLVRHVRLLVEWARQPVGTMPPQVEGLWGSVFCELEDRFQRELAVRDKLSVELGRFQQAAQAMPDGLLYLADDGGIEWLNVMAEQHFSLDRRRDLRAPITNLVRQPDFAVYLQAGRYAEPLVMHSPRRRERTLQVQIIRFAGSRRMVLSRDISKLQRLENMRRDFVANVSHEMRTPLTVVGGFLETLTESLDDFSREDVLRFLSLASEQSSRMQHLIEDLLALSALETGAPAALEEAVDAQELMHAVHRETELLSAGRHTVSLKLEGDGTLRGSPKELHSAFSNLASNAVRYTPEGGHIELGWRQDAEGGEYWVKDDGIGIEPEHIPRLTERFYRVDRGRSRETGGTGLGLAIVKHVLTRHQAELHVTSESGKGSRFAMRFPLSRISQEA